jgi:hypothetical protein
MNWTWHQREVHDPNYPAYVIRMQNRDAEIARAAAAKDAEIARAAAAAKKTPEYTASRDDIIAANALRHQIYDSIACPDCKKKAFLFGDINQKCPKCKLKSGGFRRKSKSQRRKKSKSQRRRKSIKRRH